MSQGLVLSGVPDSPRALSSRRPERVTFHTTSDVKQRLEALVAQRGWTLSKAAHLAVLAGLPLVDSEYVIIDRLSTVAQDIRRVLNDLDRYDLELQKVKRLFNELDRCGLEPEEVIRVSDLLKQCHAELERCREEKAEVGQAED